MPRQFAILAVLAAAMLWGTTGTFQSLLPEAREPLVVGAVRLWVGAASLLLLALAHPTSRRAFAKVPRSPLLFAGGFIAAYNLLFFAAVTRAGVGIGTALTIGSAPLWVALYEAAYLRQRPSARKATGQALAILGAALLVLAGQAESLTLTGIALSLAAGLSYAVYSLASSAMSPHAPSSTIAASTFTLAALLVTPVFFLLPLNWAFTGTAPVTLLALGVLSTGLAYALYTWGLKALPASTAVTLALAEPLTAWLLATFLINEPATPLKLIGAALLLAGLYVVTSEKRAEGL